MVVTPALAGSSCGAARSPYSPSPRTPQLYAPVLIGGFVPEAGVQVARLGLVSGQLTALSNHTALGAAPSFLAWGRRHRQHFVVAANHMRESPGTGLSLAAWVYRAGQPTLVPLDTVTTFDANFVCVSPGGGWVLAAAGSAGTVIRVPLRDGLGGPRFGTPLPSLPSNELGTLAHNVSLWAHEVVRPACAGMPRGLSTAPGPPRPPQVVFPPGGAPFVYAVFRDSDVVRAYSWHEATGAMAPLPGA